LKKEEPDGIEGCPTTSRQHLLWHMPEKKMKRTKQMMKIRRKDKRRKYIRGEK